MSGLTGRGDGGSDDSATSGTLTDSSTPQNHTRSSAESEWQMNYVINKKDGL